MQSRRQLAPCLIGRGTLTGFRDMLRALETLDTVDYTYAVDGRSVSEGRAALVKLMADPESSSIAVNGCLFLNAASFRYLDFEELPDRTWRYRLVADGCVLELTTVPETEAAARRPHLLLDESDPDFGSFVVHDEEEEAEE